jgi:tetratricopeptide (TPR) repeat protein
MNLAADMEDSTAKHPVTPCEVLPARELYADMLQQLHRDREALQEFETVLSKNPNRFNSLYGAGSSAEKIGDNKKAIVYFNEMSHIVDSTCDRPEWLAARSFLTRRQ